MAVVATALVFGLFGLELYSVLKNGVRQQDLRIRIKPGLTSV